MVGDVVFILRSIHSNYLTIMLCFRRLVMLLSSTNHLVLSRSCNFSFLIRLTGVLSEIFLTPCAILSLVPEVMCCWFHLVSSHLVKIMFNSFHLQLECCPNYIILIPSLSCFNQSVVSIIPLLTGVSSKCFHFAKFKFYSFHFRLERYRN